MTKVTIFLAVFFFGAFSLIVSQELAWVAKRGQSTVFLFGSIHLAKNYKPSKKAVDCVKRSSTLFLETDISNDSLAQASGLLFLSKGMFPTDSTIENYLPADSIEMLKKRLVNAGVPYGMMKRMKPWLSSLTIPMMKLSQKGFDKESGMDMHFTQIANEKRIPIESLEDPTSVAENLNALPMKSQIALLFESLDSADESEDFIDDIQKAITTNDSAEVARLVLEEFEKMDGELYSALLTKRNQAWVDVLDKKLSQPRTITVIVGMAHLMCKKQSVLQLLREKGFAISRITAGVKKRKK